MNGITLKPKKVNNMKTAQEIFEEMDNDFETYPLPICFDPIEELKELNLRSGRIKRLADEAFAAQFTTPPVTVEKITEVLNKYTDHIGGEKVIAIDDFKFPDLAKELAGLFATQPPVQSYIKYLIEDKREQHGKWLCLGEMFDTSKLAEHDQSKWTNDANYALQWETFDEAEKHRAEFWDMPDYEVTEHEFIGKQCSCKEKIECCNKCTLQPPVQGKEVLADLGEQLDMSGMKVVFGLEAQGHIPTIQKEIKRWNDAYKEQFPDEEPLDMTYSKHVWDGIGNMIGWCPFAAALSYLEWLSITTLPAQVQGYSNSEMRSMLEDVVNELNLSGDMIEKHGPLGTAPAELVRLVLEQKDKQIAMLKVGMKQIC